MEEYYFLLGLCFVWSVFAVVQDYRKREVANWLNFSLIVFALAYRAFYAIINNNILFFVSGLAGLFSFVWLAYLFYYGRAFAGGDAKLLMGYGVILPYGTLNGLLYWGFLFLIFLFLGGAVYTLIYSLFIIGKNRKRFFREYVGQFKKYQFLLIFILILSIALSFLIKEILFFFVFLFVLFLLPYVKALDLSMTALKNYKDLQEGDWIEQDIKVGKNTIKRTVHGLSKEDILLLRKYKRNIYVKDGVPFTPAFLIGLFMVFFFLILQFSLF